jgi:hypothetical protein
MVTVPVHKEQHTGHWPHLLAWIFGRPKLLVQVTILAISCAMHRYGLTNAGHLPISRPDYLFGITHARCCCCQVAVGKTKDSRHVLKIVPSHSGMRLDRKRGKWRHEGFRKVNSRSNRCVVSRFIELPFRSRNDDITMSFAFI